MKIYKYPIEVTDIQKVSLPSDAEIVSAQFQRDVLCLWAKVEPGNRPIQRTIFVYGTGNNMNGFAQKFIATVQQGDFVWHIFEELP